MGGGYLSLYFLAERQEIKGRQTSLGGTVALRSVYKNFPESYSSSASLIAEPAIVMLGFSFYGYSGRFYILA